MIHSCRHLRTRLSAVANIISVPDKIRESAKVLYFTGYSVEEIARKLNILPDTVSLWVFGSDGKGTSSSCWAVKRAQANDASIIAYIIDKHEMFDRTVNVAHKCLTKALEGLNERVHTGETVLNMDEIRKLAAVVTEMDKITRLEGGKATNIIETTTGLSANELRKIIKEDPIADDVVVEYKELDDI